MADPIGSVRGTDPLGAASTVQVEPAQSAGSRLQRPAGVQSDTADVTSVEALLATITKAANAVPPIDQTRVAELQQAINSGTYQANPQQIAKMLMEIEALLASKGNGS
jgi:negative regulator of flagellin synthesis FlgM